MNKQNKKQLYETCREFTNIEKRLEVISRIETDEINKTFYKEFFDISVELYCFAEAKGSDAFYGDIEEYAKQYIKNKNTFRRKISKEIKESIKYLEVKMDEECNSLDNMPDNLRDTSDIGFNKECDIDILDSIISSLKDWNKKFKSTYTNKDNRKINDFIVTTLCGSTRFKQEFLDIQKKLTLEGRIVISVGLFGHSGDEEVWTEGTKEMLDRMHKRKIDMADGIFVINKGGYIGDSTRSEIEYAKQHHKKIEYLEPINK